jgi:hypothetical protein
MYSQYIYSIILFVVNNWDLYRSDYETHSLNFNILQTCTYPYHDWLSLKNDHTTLVSGYIIIYHLILKLQAIILNCWNRF